MIELNEPQHPLAGDLAEPSPLTVEPRAVLRGPQPGWVFVDRFPSPRFGLVWTPGMEGAYLLGPSPPSDAGALLTELVDTNLAPKLLARGETYLEVSGANAAWDRVIAETFGHRELQHDDQIIFRSTTETPRLESSEQVAPLERVLHDRSFADPLGIRSTVLKFWHSTSDFSHRGVGFCSLAEGRIVALCFSGYVDENVHAVDITTAQDFRRRGHGLAAARAFVSTCVHKGGVVHWDCTASNHASRKLAERLGLVQVAQYRSYYFKL